MKTRRFLVCLHDATPAFARETSQILRDLAPLVGRRLSIGVVPDWHGGWPLASHRAYCRLIRESAGELLLHGYLHRRLRGWGPIGLFAGNCDEMNGLDAEAARQTIERGQRAFIDVFGEPARTFLPPAWQRGRVRLSDASSPELRHVLGFLSLDSSTGRKIPLATYTWDCSRWAWPGYVGHGVGRLLHSMDRVPTLAIHPRDVERGFWPTIRRLTQELLDAGYEPVTPSELMGCSSRYSMPSWTDERVS